MAYFQKYAKKSMDSFFTKFDSCIFAVFKATKMSKQFISERIIEQQALAVSNAQDDFDALVEHFKTAQPIFLGYLFSESFRILTQEEREFLLYLALVIWKSCEEGFGDLPVITQQLLEEKEEANWTKLNESVAKHFREKLDNFFEGYPQEDLLAFVEDALVISEEGEEAEDFEVSKEGREPIFIALCTLIDCLTTP